MNHKLLLLRAVVLGFCLVSIATAQTPANSTTDPALSRLQSELEPKIKEEIQQGRLPGFAIGVVKNGKLIYAKGLASPGSAAPHPSRQSLSSTWPQ